jgi:plastocyanin
VENVRGSLTNGKKVQIDQSNKQFVPGWAVVEKGTTVEFPNEDNIYHNVFSRSAGNSFDLGLYRKGDGAKSHRFIRPGPVDVFCNIHPQMAASILVVPNRYFAKVQPDGSYVIEGVPAGRRKLVAWAPGSRAATEWVEVLDGGRATLDLALQSKGTGHANKFGKPYGSYP